MRRLCTYNQAKLKFVTTWLLALTLPWTQASTISYAQDSDGSAVALVYHRFGENNVPTTNVRLEQFEEQIRILKKGGHVFLSSEALVARLKNNASIPDKTVIITADDAYKSIATEAWPRLKAAGIPLTIFVSTDVVDEARNQFLTWNEIRALVADGVTIAQHSKRHLHMTEAGVEATRADINAASNRFIDELGFVPKIISYPYGEYDKDIRALLIEMGFDAAFAQYSGVIHGDSDRYSLPRFPVNEQYGDAERFVLVTNAKALRVNNITPLDPVIKPKQNPPLYGFSLNKNQSNIKNLNCFASHMSAPTEVIRIGDTRIEVRFDKPFPYGRNRINCTAPADSDRWYWLGKFFYVPGGPLD